MTWGVRAGMFVVPAAAFVATRRIRRGPRSREGGLVAHGRATGVVKRPPYGECAEVRRPLDRARPHTPTAHERPRGTRRP
ncbi:hypothetical protein ABTX62_07065 [Streptomyces sp. NPDC096046]|uniref:hypothetical protein n=1 Tax=Streptomyces sp. NPDC096046 TaxID=3155542 RepID=UPI003318C770